MHCTTEVGFRLARPTKCNGCYHPSRPKPEGWEHGPSDTNLRVSTRWRWNGRRRPAYRVLEVADQFAFLAIDADDGKTLLLEASPQRADMLELLIAVGTGVGGDLLAVDTQREIHLVQKTSDSLGRDRYVDLLKNLGDLLRRLAGPLQPADGFSGRVVLQKNLDGREYFGRFFSTCMLPVSLLVSLSS